MKPQSRICPVCDNIVLHGSCAACGFHDEKLEPQYESSQALEQSMYADCVKQIAQTTLAQGSVSDTPETDKHHEATELTIKDLQSTNESLRKENDIAKDLISLYAEGKDAESLRREALIVRKDAWINMVPHATHCPLSHLSRFSTKGAVCECGKHNALSPTISSSLVEDKEASKDLDFLISNSIFKLGYPPNPSTINMSVEVPLLVEYKNEDLREAIRAARNSSKPNSIHE